MPANDSCLRCGASLSLVERANMENAVDITGKGSICPNCYQELSPEEYNYYFKS